MNPPLPSMEAIGSIASSNTISSTAMLTPLPPSLNNAQLAGVNPVAGFGQWFTREVESVNAQMVTAERGVQQLAVGGVANLHETMIQLEQARLAFQLAIQVRSRVMEAYSEIMRMQV